MSLPPMDVASRSDRLRASLDGCDALLVTRLANIRYLTGFTGSAALLLVLQDELVLVTDGRYTQQAAEQVDEAGVDARVEVRATAAQQLEVVQASLGGLRRLGLEAGDVTWSAQRRYAEVLGEVDLVPTEGTVEALRRVKDEGEVARIEAACAIADEAFAALRPRVGDGATERELALELDFTMRRLGAADVSFETIVASGPNGAKPHARPSDRRVEEGDLVVFDFGALVDGYHSDMTRTVMAGDPTPTQQRMYDVVLESQAAGVAAVAAGVDAKAVDAACREVIAAAGWADAFLHGTGHGVGLDIHEDPRVGSTAAGSLAPGHVVTVEPGVYLPEHGGVRIEDTVVVTATGCRRLTNAPKDLQLR